MILLASLLLAAPALAGPKARVQLPAGEDPALWAGPLAVAGLVEGAAGGEGEWIELVGGTGAWALRVRDRSGRLRQLAVEPPPDQTAREDLLWLALSLLHPAATVPSQPPAESERRRPPRSSRPSASARHHEAARFPPPSADPPSEAGRTRPPPTEAVRISPPPADLPSESVRTPPTPEDPPPEAVPTLPPVVSPPPSAPDRPAESRPSSSVPPPPTRRLDPSVPSPEASSRWSAALPRFYLGLGTGVEVPLSSTPTPALGIEGGVDVGGRARFGLRIQSVAPTVLYAPADAQWMAGVSVQSAAGFDVGRRRPIWLRLALGGRWLELRGAALRQDLNNLGMPGATTRLRAAGIVGSVGISVPWRLGESAVIAPYAVLEGGSYDPGDVRAGAAVLIPVSLRFGFEVLVMRHVGAGLPFPGRASRRFDKSK